MSSQATLGGAAVREPRVSVPTQPDRERRQRILAALGLPSPRITTGGQPHCSQPQLRVDEETLTRYYDYLVERLELPFVAYYPPPSNNARVAADRLEVIELLDPRDGLCDEIDGLFCRTRKGKFFVNLPLVELTVLPPSGNVDLLGDYEYWFWHWRD